MPKPRTCPHCEKIVPRGRAGTNHITWCEADCAKKLRRLQKRDKVRAQIRRSLSGSLRRKSLAERTNSLRTGSLLHLDSQSEPPRQPGAAVAEQSLNLAIRPRTLSLVIQEEIRRRDSDGDTEILEIWPHGENKATPLPQVQLLRPRVPFRDVLPASSTLEPAEGYDDTSIPWRTKPDAFGLYRIYIFGKPIYTPDHAFTLLHLADSSNIEHQVVQFSSSFPPEDIEDWLGAGIFPNATIALVMKWYYGSQSVIASKQRMDDFIRDVIQHPEFRAEDLKNFRMDIGMKALDDYDRKRNEASAETPFPIRDNWNSETVYITAPCPGFPQRTEATTKQFPIKNVMYRKLMDVIMAAFREPSAQYFHLAPFQEFYKPPGFGKTHERQYGELYKTTPQMRSLKHMRSTLLANFGNQSLWPIYLALGNLSKYIRANPSSFALHYLAYIPKLPDNINDWWTCVFGGSSPVDDSLSHMRCEMFQAVWILLLDADLMHAYVHGYDSNEFPDGVTRRVFPRFFTYATDYLEKILTVCIKNLSNCPCPRCLVSKSRVDQLGTPEDMENRTKFARKDDEKTHKKITSARNRLYKQGVGFKDKTVVAKLGPESLRPTRNAFSEKLAEHGFNSYELVSPDLLHEFELGVFKSVFTHLLRILQCLGKLSDIDARYCEFPTFDRGTIRKFRNNVSAMTKFAARDFEDVLQCAIPAFEGLIPAPHGVLVRRLLFELVTWHALAKLRRHSDPSTTDLEASTVRLGELLREFRDTTCEIYDTTDLPTQQSNRSRKKRKSTKKRKFNLTTYKLHSLGHYVRYIRWKGTTDSFSSQSNEHEHVRPKRHRFRAPRAKDLLLAGIATQGRRERLMWEITEAHEHSHPTQTGKKKKKKKNPLFDVPENEHNTQTAPQIHHSMSQKVEPEQQLNMLVLLRTHSTDPALTGFARKLKTHLLSRLLGLPFDSDETYFTDEDLGQVIIIDSILYRHRTIQINFTTYDLRREQDSINPNTGIRAVMLLSNEDYDPDSPNHPYWYCQVLGVFHCYVIHNGPRSSSRQPQSMQFLWVRWLALEKDWEFGFQAKHLPRLSFVDEAVDGTAAFRFVDPANVVREVHLIPDEDSGRNARGLGPSMVRREDDGFNDNQDWDTFWLNMFVDRDMFMRYRGGGAGHAAVRDAVDEFLLDRDAVDVEHQEKRAAELEGPEYQIWQEVVGDAQALQDAEDRDGWEDEFGDSMDEEEDEDYGYTRQDASEAGDLTADEDYEYRESEDDENGRGW